MRESFRQLERLRTAVRHPVAAITAVEIDTVARGHDLIAGLRPLASDRPVAVLEFDTREVQSQDLYDRARAATEGWPPEQGLLFLLDRSGAADRDPVEFWRGMNFLRESWDALAAHTILLLLPANYRLLNTVADHLADWIPLRFHFRGQREPAGFAPLAPHHEVGAEWQLTPTVARQRLTELEPALWEALAAGSLGPAGLIRRYYLPMFQAALSLNDLQHAQRIYDRIDQQLIPHADRPLWWSMACRYHLVRFELPVAKDMANCLPEHSRQTNDPLTEADAFYQLGRIAQEQRDFSAAEAWYRKSLAISEKQGNEHDAASTCHQLGVLAAVQARYREAGQWFLRALAVFQQSDPHAAEITVRSFHQLYQQTEPSARDTLRAIWQQAELGPWPEPRAANSN